MTTTLLLPPDIRSRAKRLGAVYSRSERSWIHPADPLPRPLRKYAPPRFSPEWFELATSPGITLPPSSPAADITLREHQRSASNMIVRAYRMGLPGFLLADDVGLGKTYAVLDAVRRMASRRSTNPLQVLVLAPLSVVPHWRLSIDTFGVPNALFLVTNYEQAKNLLYVPKTAKNAKRTRTRNKRHAQHGRSRVTWDLVIFDESHRLKNPASQRSAAARRLVTTNRLGNRTNAAYTVWMSATAGQDPLELAYLAPLLAAHHGQRVRDLKDFELWCKDIGLGVKRGSFGAWEWVGDVADLDLMHSLLFDPFRPKGTPARTRAIAGLRRKPTDVDGWPELVRQPSPVALSASQMTAYRRAWEEFRATLAFIDSDSARLSPNKNTSKKLNPLVAALRFRQKASLLRAGQTAQMAVDMVEAGLRPAISVQFHDSTDAIVAEMPPSCRTGVIDGRVSPAEREDVRRAFQRGELDVVLFSPTEGISLHAGEKAVGGDTKRRVLLIHDVRWSALEMAQIEGRTHRDGQAAVAHYLFAADTVEERVVAAVTSKLAAMATMMGDDTAGLDALLAAAQEGRV